MTEPFIASRGKSELAISLRVSNTVILTSRLNGKLPKVAIAASNIEFENMAGKCWATNIKFMIREKTDQPPSKKDTGSIYALFEPSPDRTLNPAGQFNTSRIVARGNRIDHWLNGQLIASASIGNAEWEKRVAESKFNDVPDFGRNARGRIMLTDHGAEVWYRNLKISSPPEPSGSNTVMPK